MKFYQKFIKTNDLCFDIGANLGNRTELFLALGARVVCVEPQPTCVEALRRKYRNERKVTIIAKGAAEKKGELELSLCDTTSVIATFSNKWKTGRFKDSTWSTTVKVPITTLDELIAEFGTPKFCKIDVEGFEYHVINGLSSSIPIVSFEFTKEFLEDALLCMKRLEELGDVRFNYVIGENASLELPEWKKSDFLNDLLQQSTNMSLWGDIYAFYLNHPQ